MPLLAVVPSLIGAPPPASDCCVATPAWKAEKSSTEYGLATTNASSAQISASAKRRSAIRVAPPAPSQPAATSRQTSMIPPVYLVAAASPIATPEIT